MTNYYYCSECDNTVAFGHNCPAFITPSNMNESKPYMSPQGYVDPTSKYYIDRVWEEYLKLKEELADTMSKLAQVEDMIDIQRTLIKQIHKDEDELIRTIETLREPSKEVTDAAFIAWKNAECGDDAFVLAIRAAVATAEQKNYGGLHTDGNGVTIRAETWEDVRARCS